MKSEEEIRELVTSLILDLETKLPKRKTHYIGKLRGMLEGLEWVLEDEDKDK